jgi:exodeoxyribonuclease V beta subunit
MQRFDLLGDLPGQRTTTVLEASAGTGKTFALAGLVTRYLAEGITTLDRMLLITFSRAASRELRERVRGQIVQAAAALEERPAQATDLIEHLLQGTVEERERRLARLRDALSGFDAATIATTHEFCGLVLKSLGVAGDTDSGVTLVESLDDLVVEIVDDIYLADFAQRDDDPPMAYRDALALARAVVGDPCAQLRPQDPRPDTKAAARLDFADKVVTELEHRKRRIGVLGYDDLLSRLAKALEGEQSPARDRMRQRWPIVMVDEFQDTDPVQWQVIDRAFSGHSTVILIGDPKQAIYAFRGGDIVTYLRAADTAKDRRLTLGVNWRSDKALVDSLHAVWGGAELGHPDIVVRQIDAHHPGHRLSGAPHNDPFRLRVVGRDRFGVDQDRTIAIKQLRPYIAEDLATDISALLASGAMFDGNPVTAGDIAVIVEKGDDARPCRDALAAIGIPVIYTGDTDVFDSDAAADWLALLEAFDQPHRSGIVRAAAATMFFGKTADDLAAGGDALTEQVTATIREWAGQARERGVAAVFEAAQLAGMDERVLRRRGGERDMTDLAHVGQLLHEVAHRERFNLPALRDWLRRQREERSGPDERNRRLDSDAAAVQIMTVWGSKGLQFPIVYLPFAFNRHVRVDDVALFHDDDGTRCLHIGGKDSPDRGEVEELSKAEEARNDIRLTYVALTRAKSQVVAWWAPSWDEPTGGLSRLLRGRRIGDPKVPDRCSPSTVSDQVAVERFREWQDAGGPMVEQAVLGPAFAAERPELPSDLDVRHFHRLIDTQWRRTSYTALIKSTEQAGVGSEPEVTARDDEVDTAPGTAPTSVGADIASPMTELPAGAAFGSLVHAVLENADPLAADLAAELEVHVREQMAWWAVDVEPSPLAGALVPMHDTPLGPLADGLTLRQIGLSDRLRELDFEIPLAGGDLRALAPEVTLADVGRLLGERLETDDPLARYAGRLTSDALGGQSLRGYLSGSIDVVLRLPGQRFVVVDYKTNRLGDSAADYGSSRLAEAMLHSDYPLQALLYSVVLHRYLRWRLPGYDPHQHLSGVMYLFVRGMCGPQTPVIDGHPCGVFSWTPPVSMVTELSDILDRGRSAA